MKTLLTLTIFLFVFQPDTTKKDTLKFTKVRQVQMKDTTKIIQTKLDIILQKIKENNNGKEKKNTF